MTTEYVLGHPINASTLFLGQAGVFLLQTAFFVIAPRVEMKSTMFKDLILHMFVITVLHNDEASRFVLLLWFIQIDNGIVWYCNNMIQSVRRRNIVVMLKYALVILYVLLFTNGFGFRDTKSPALYCALLLALLFKKMFLEISIRE